MVAADESRDEVRWKRADGLSYSVFNTESGDRLRTDVRPLATHT